MLADGLVELSLEVFVCEHRGVVEGSIGLLRLRSLLEEVHHLFEVIFGALHGFTLLLVVRLQKGDIITVHAV